MDRTEEGLGEHLLIKLKTFYFKVRLSKTTVTCYYQKAAPMQWLGQ